RVVEVEQALPGRGDLHGVDEGAVAEHLAHLVGDVVAVGEPLAAGLLAEIGAARELELAEGEAGLDVGADPRALEADDQAAAAAADSIGQGAGDAVDEL